MISPELAEFVESGIATSVATRDARLRPDCVRGVGARVVAGGAAIELLVPVATASRTLANVRDNGRVAVVFGRASDHRSIQIKGRAIEVRDGGEDDRRFAAEFLRRLAGDWQVVGVPAKFVLSITSWPNVVLRVAVEEIYVQTPGPNAGAAIANGEGAGAKGGGAPS